MTTDREARSSEFIARLEALQSEFWDVVAVPDRDNTDAVLEAAEEGLDDEAKLYPEGWMLVTSVASIEDSSRSRVLVRHSPEGQSPFLSAGMLLSAADAIM